MSAGLEIIHPDHDPDSQQADERTIADWLQHPGQNLPEMSSTVRERLAQLGGGASLYDVADVLPALARSSRIIITQLISGEDRATILAAWHGDEVLAAYADIQQALRDASESQGSSNLEAEGEEVIVQEEESRVSDSTIYGYDRGEVAKFYSLINAATKEKYLLDIDSANSADIVDELLALMALYATTRTRRQGEIGRAIDVLQDSLISGNGAAARKHNLSVANAGMRRKQIAGRIALALDVLYGVVENDNLTKQAVPSTRLKATKQAESRSKQPTKTRDSYVGDDHLKMHLQAVGKVPLLNAEQEVELAKRIEAGLVAQSILDGNFSSDVQEAHSEELEWLAKDGQQAFQHFIAANPRLAINIAGRFRRATTDSMQFEDMVQAGTEGVIRAVQKFDYKKGYKFSTYATGWIRQAIQRAIADESRTIRIPVHATEQVNAINRYVREFIAEHSRDPSDEEIAAKLELKVDKVRELRDASRMPISIHTPLSEDGDELGALIPGDDGRDLFASIVQAGMSREYVRDIINSYLTTQEADVIFRRFGFAGEEETLDRIAKDYEVSRERIRQVEGQAMGKLRHRLRYVDQNGVLTTHPSPTPRRRGRKPSYDIDALIERAEGRLDSSDIELLEALQATGSQVEASKQLGVSNSHISNRIKYIKRVLEAD